MDFKNTVKGSLLEGFFPAGWDMEKIDGCCSNKPEEITKHQEWWNKDFVPVSCDSIQDFDMMMGHEIAIEIKRAGDEGRKLAMILPVGPMGMSLWMTLRYGPDMWIPSTFMPTLPGKLFFMKELAGPLVAGCN